MRKLHVVAISSAVLVLGALGVQTASAAEFHASTAPVTFTGTPTTSHIFKTNAGTVTCKALHFQGVAVAKTSATATATPNELTNGQCTAFGFINIPIHINGCGYLLNANGTTNIECPAGKTIEITAPGCTTKVGAQHLASGMTYTTVGVSPNRHISAHTNITGIKYNECGTDLTNGTYTGSTTVKAASGEIWYT